MPELTKRTLVLLVEDDNDLRNTLAGKLGGNYEVLHAENGEQAITRIVDNHPDLVLLDLMIPKLDGFKVLERLRKYPDPQISSTPVVVLSNLWSSQDILQVQGLKVNEYFVKAHTKIEEVINRIHEILGQSAQV